MQQKLIFVELNVAHVDFSSFTTKTNLASLKAEVDKLDIDKLTPIPNDLAKLSNVVKNDVVKKTEYNKLITKVDDIDTTGFVLKTKYGTDKPDLEKKVSDAEKKILLKMHLLKMQIIVNNRKFLSKIKTSRFSNKKQNLILNCFNNYFK